MFMFLETAVGTSLSDTQDILRFHHTKKSEILNTSVINFDNQAHSFGKRIQIDIY